MATNAMHMHERPARARPEQEIQVRVPGELNVWLFVSVVPATLAAVIVALAMVVPH